MAGQGVATLTSMSTSCSCGCSPKPNLSGNASVLVNGKPVSTVGMHWNDHTCDDCSHPMMTVTGNSTVLVCGKPIVRIGDVLSDGASVATGSGSVLA